MFIFFLFSTFHVFHIKKQENVTSYNYIVKMACVPVFPCHDGCGTW